MTLVLLGLAAAASGIAVYWYFLFKRLLPLEMALRRSRGQADDLKMFSLEILEGEHSGALPHSPAEIGQRALRAVGKFAPDLQLWWISKEKQSGAVSVQAARQGAGGGTVRLENESFGLEAYEDVFAQGGVSRDLRSKAEAGDKAYLTALAEAGIRRVRMVAWGKQNGPSGILIAGDPDPAGRDLARMRPFLDLVRPLAGSLASASENLSALAQAQESLQDGLSTAIADLTDTRGLLIQRSRQIKTLHDVVTTLMPHTAQTQSTLSAIVSIVAKSIGADMVAFLLLDETGSELVTQPGAYGLESQDLFYRISLAEEDSSSVRAFKSGEPFVTGDAQNDTQVLSRYAKLWKTNSLMVIPLKVDDHSIGVMRIGSYKRDYFTREHVELMSVIAREAAIIVETAMLNRKLSETAEQLTALNRMKDDFVSTVSHEFKTPLTTIMGFLTVILEGETGPMTEQQGKFLEIAMGAAKRLAGLVSDLLDISKLEGGAQMEMKTYALGNILQASLENHRHNAAKAGKKLTHDVPEQLPSVVCDERWIGVALDNLVSNGLKFTKPQGTVHVSAVDKGEFLMICVTDDGIGIPQEDKARIFEKFFRAANRADIVAAGTGLGLAIAKEIITKHGGKIWFESDLDRGSKFFFILKVAPR